MYIYIYVERKREREREREREIDVVTTSCKSLSQWKIMIASMEDQYGILLMMASLSTIDYY